MPTKKRGRPRKHGVKNPSALARALMVIYAYDEARKDGLKHSAAIREAVAFVKRLRPEMSVSETEVRRILAELRPSDGQVALRSSCEIVEGKEAARLRKLLAQIRAFTGSKSATVLSSQDPERPLRKFYIGYMKRPIYPRHNAKSPHS
jgi:hypothetical protein